MPAESCTLPSCACIRHYTIPDKLDAIYGALLGILTAVGGGTTDDQFTSTVDNASASGSIPAGVLGWSVTALTGTVTVAGEALPVGATVSGGGYLGKTTTAAIPYTIAAGTALIVYDTPA